MRLKWSTASRTDRKGADVSTSALPPPAPGGAGPRASAFMGTRAEPEGKAGLGSVLFLGSVGGLDDERASQRNRRQWKKARWLRSGCFLLRVSSWLTPW
jgi:hypothetical protein